MSNGSSQISCDEPFVIRVGATGRLLNFFRDVSGRGRLRFSRQQKTLRARVILISLTGDLFHRKINPITKGK